MYYPLLISTIYYIILHGVWGGALPSGSRLYSILLEKSRPLWVYYSFGAGAEGRTLMTSLENSHNSRYMTPAIIGILGLFFTVLYYSVIRYVLLDFRCFE